MITVQMHSIHHSREFDFFLNVIESNWELQALVQFALEVWLDWQKAEEDGRMWQ